MTIEEIKFAETQVTILETRLDDAKILLNKLRTQYLEENGKFKVGENVICKYDEYEKNRKIYTIRGSTIYNDGTIAYMCMSDSGLMIFFSEDRIMKANQ